ncbi:MAG: helix-turn-helix domain-containing protein [Saprospiraceae bacterium]
MAVNINDRILEIMKYYGYNRTQLAEKLELHPTTMGKIVNKLSTPNGATLAKILNEFPDLSAEWLMRGSGEMIQEKNLDIEENSHTSKQLNKVKEEVRKIKSRLDKIEKEKE